MNNYIYFAKVGYRAKATSAMKTIKNRKKKCLPVYVFENESDAWARIPVLERGERFCIICIDRAKEEYWSIEEPDRKLSCEGINEAEFIVTK